MSSDFKINDLQLKYLELETLLDITHELNSFDQIPVLLQEILIKSCGVLNASSGLILIEDDNSDILHIGASPVRTQECAHVLERLRGIEGPERTHQ